MVREGWSASRGFKEGVMINGVRECSLTPISQLGRHSVSCTRPTSLRSDKNRNVKLKVMKINEDTGDK
jgi:hypothetical protein